MTTTADLIAETRRHLESYRRSPMNQLASAVDASTTTLTFTHDAGQIQSGSYLEIDLEMVYVWSVDQGSKTAIVQRGQVGSTAATHDTAAVVKINPSFPDFAIFKALNDDLLDLASPINGLFAIRSVDLTASVGVGSYDLTGSTNVLEILSVRHNVPGVTDSWATISNYELTQQAGATFASGTSLEIHDSVVPGHTIRVLYKSTFSPLTALANDVETVAGLPASMHDIPPLGAAMRLVAPREVARNQTEVQGDSRRADEVPAGAVLGSLRGLMALRQNRITNEASRLTQRFPDRGFIPVGPVGLGW